MKNWMSMMMGVACASDPDKNQGVHIVPRRPEARGSRFEHLFWGVRKPAEKLLVRITYGDQEVILAYENESQLENIKKTLKDLPNIVKVGDPMKELKFWKEMMGDALSPSKIKKEWENIKALVDKNKIDFNNIKFENITFEDLQG